MRPDLEEAVRRGRALFNAGQFWDAHEAWEVAWHVEAGESRRMLHGLIQVAAGFHHALVTRRAGGAVKLLRSGLDKLGPVPDGAGGLALGQFRDDVVRTLDTVTAWQRGEGAPLDPRLVPRLALR